MSVPKTLWNIILVVVLGITVYAAANVLIPEPGPYEKMAEMASEQCGVDIDSDTANWNALDPIPNFNRGYDWYWYGTRFRADDGGYVKVYELANHTEGLGPERVHVYCPDGRRGVERG